jgi:hypothetical protein
MAKLFSTIRVAVPVVVWPLLIHAISCAGPLQAGEYADGVLTAGAGKSSAIPATVIHQIPSPDTYSNGLAWDGQSLWNCGAFTSMMYELDPSDGTVLTSYDTGIAGLRGLAFGDDHLWVSSWNTETIYKLVPADGTIVHSFPAPFAGKPDGLAWDNGVLWIAEEDGLIYRVDSESGQVLSSIPPPPGCCFNPRGLAWDATNLWAGYQTVGLIYKLDPADGSVRDVFDSPSGPFQQGLTFDGRYLWSTGGDNIIYQLAVGCQASIQVRGDVHTPGGTLPVRIHIAHNRPETVTVPWELSLIDPGGQVVAKRVTPPHTFEPGDVVDVELALPLPKDLEGGTYTLRLGISGMAGTGGATTSFEVVRAK